MNRLLKFLQTNVAVAAIVLALTPAAQAADYTYAPEGCDFRMTFPEQPLSETRCNPDDPKKCYKTATFNRVFALDSSVRITATCNPAEKDMLTRYSGEVMQYTLESMAKDAVSEYQTSFADHKDAKEAILLGSRTMPDGTVKIYMAQLWISKKSVLTLEADVTGAETPDSDALFIGIMKSVRLAAWDEKAAESPVQQVEKEEKKDISPAEETGQDDKKEE